MTDIALIQQPDGSFDIALDGPDLQADDTLQNAVILSLFCDARADAGDVLPVPGDTDLRGYWGDAYADVSGDSWGSKLWLLERAVCDQDTLDRAQQYAQEALQWMVDDGVAAEVTVTTSYPFPGRMRIAGEITKPDGTTVPFSYDYVWRNTQNALS